MDGVVFIGDEVTAAGFRLAGAQVQTPGLEQAAEVISHALERATFVVMTAEYARELPAARLEQVMAAARPLVLVIEDARGRVSPPNVHARARRALGVQA